MTPKISKYLLAAPCLIAILGVAADTISAQRDCCQGDWWMKWNRSQRESYVLGYTTGYSHGFMAGCENGTKDWPVEVKGYDNLPMNKCLHGQPDLSQDPELVVSTVTEFYTKHPEDHDILPYEMIDLLGKGLSVEQIHRYPFMRHDRPATNP